MAKPTPKLSLKTIAEHIAGVADFSDVEYVSYGSPHMEDERLSFWCGPGEVFTCGYSGEFAHVAEQGFKEAVDTRTGVRVFIQSSKISEETNCGTYMHVEFQSGNSIPYQPAGNN